MDPITGAMTLVGLGVSIFGGGGGLLSGMSASSIASQEAAVSGDITKLQGQENDQRQLAMQISARRNMIQQVRQTQLSQATSKAAATNQGGLQSSGYAGGQAQAAGQGAYNIEGTSQNLQIGNNLFGIQRRITADQFKMAALGGQLATAQGESSMFQGISSIGGALMGQAGPAGNILGNFFNNSQDPTWSGYNQTGLFTNG